MCPQGRGGSSPLFRTASLVNATRVSTRTSNRRCTRRPSGACVLRLEFGSFADARPLRFAAFQSQPSPLFRTERGVVATRVSTRTRPTVYSAPFGRLRTAAGIRQLRGLRPLRFAVFQSHASPLQPRVAGCWGCQRWGSGLHFFHGGCRLFIAGWGWSGLVLFDFGYLAELQLRYGSCICSGCGWKS